jgi:hypothetical protein
MKKVIIALALATGITAIAYASLRGSNSNTKQDTEKKQDVKKEKKECKRTCLFG